MPWALEFPRNLRIVVHTIETNVFPKRLGNIRWSVTVQLGVQRNANGRIPVVRVDPIPFARLEFQRGLDTKRTIGISRCYTDI